MEQQNIDEKITNRRHDDIVLVIRHDFFAVAGKNKIVIEFINEYGKKLFNLSDAMLYNSSNEELCLENILDNKVSQIIQNNLNDESDDKFRARDLADILRKISNFTIMNGDFKSILVNLRIFHIYKKDNILRRKNIASSYYYLIMREIDIDMKVAEFRINFLKKLNTTVVFDPLTNIPDVKSTINEIKMLIEFNKKEKSDIVIALIEINKNKDQTLFSSIVVQLKKRIRDNDYLGCFTSITIDDKNQLLLILHNNKLDAVYKPLFRLYTSVIGDQYIVEKYKNQREGILSIGYTQIKQSDDLQGILCRLDSAVKNNKNLLSEIKISTIK